MIIEKKLTDLKTGREILSNIVNPIIEDYKKKLEEQFPEYNYNISYTDDTKIELNVKKSYVTYSLVIMILESINKNGLRNDIGLSIYFNSFFKSMRKKYQLLFIDNKWIIRDRINENYEVDDKIFIEIINKFLEGIDVNREQVHFIEETEGLYNLFVNKIEKEFGVDEYSINYTKLDGELNLFINDNELHIGFGNPISVIFNFGQKNQEVIQLYYFEDKWMVPALSDWNNSNEMQIFDENYLNRIIRHFKAISNFKK